MDSANDRTEKLLALLLLQKLEGSPLRERVRALNLAGFSNVEIADLLETSAQVVRQRLYKARSAGGSREGEPGRSGGGNCPRGRFSQETTLRG